MTVHIRWVVAFALLGYVVGLASVQPVKITLQDCNGTVIRKHP